MKEERWKGIERVREEMIEKGETRARAISRLLAVALCSRPVRGKSRNNVKEVQTETKTRKKGTENLSLCSAWQLNVSPAS